MCWYSIKDKISAPIFSTRKSRDGFHPKKREQVYQVQYKLPAKRKRIAGLLKIFLSM